MAIQDITRLSFEAFRSRMRPAAGPMQISAHQFSRPEDAWIVTPEYDYNKIFGQLGVKGGIHVAVAGSLSPGLGQLSELEPALTLFEDINDAAIDLLSFYGSCIQKYPDGGGLICLLNYCLMMQGKDSDRQAFDMLRQIAPAGLEEGVARSFMAERSRVKEHIGNWSSVQHIIDGVLANHDDGYWYSFERYMIVRDAWLAGRVKGVCADITAGGFSLALDIARQTNEKITLIYPSNINWYIGPAQRRRFAGGISYGLEQGLIHPGCKVVDWENCETRIVPVRDYVGFLNS
jgi:hypothetical protein